ncbi:hypothetical protein NL676_017307 [Syzygium grande]|nr:hypothetical protein NL676_017307 [Syzygium grande]
MTEEIQTRRPDESLRREEKEGANVRSANANGKTECLFCLVVSAADLFSSQGVEKERPFEGVFPSPSTLLSFPFRATQTKGLRGLHNHQSIASRFSCSFLLIDPSFSIESCHRAAPDIGESHRKRFSILSGRFSSAWGRPSHKHHQDQPPFKGGFVI